MAMFYTRCYVALIIMETMKKIDCTKITTLEEVKLILASLDLHININAEHYDKLKHLVVDK